MFQVKLAITKSVADIFVASDPLNTVY